MYVSTPTMLATIMFVGAVAALSQPAPSTTLSGSFSLND